MKNSRAFTLWLITTIIFMVLVFIQSNTPYSKQDIKPILKERVQLEKVDIEIRYNQHTISGDQPYEFWEFVLRKMGHVVEYAILTFLWIKTFSCTKLNKGMTLLNSFILSFLFALTDEWHQVFIDGRTGQLIDVLTVDTAGMLLTILGFLFVWNTVKFRVPRR